MPSNIYVVRHGQDEDNQAGILNGRRDKPLTELGRSQSANLADKLAGHKIQVVYSSPLKRAYETAKIIADKLDIKQIIVEPDLIEREFGVMTGTLVADIPKNSSNNLLGDKVIYFIDPEGAELFPDLFNRAKQALSKIQKAQPDKNILIVTHGDLGKMIRAAYHNWTWKDGLLTPYLDNTGVLELKPSKDIVE